MNLNQLQMHNLAPRGINGTCVPTSICFATGVSYYDVEEVLLREQPKTYRPDIKGNCGVDSHKLLGDERTIFGHRFTKIDLYCDRVFQVVNSRPAGTYLVVVPHHMLVIKDGQIYDLANTRANEMVRGVWKVEKVS